MLEEHLRRVPLFAALPERELLYLSESLHAREFAPGRLIFTEGDTTGDFYILVDGEVEVIKALGTPDERLLAVRGAGTVIGELSLFSPGGQHTAAVRALTRVQALEMTRANFDALLHRHPGLTYAMVQTIGLRLIEAEQGTIRDLREKNRQLTEAYQELAAAQAQIIEKEKLERELEVARRIQGSLLPRALPHPPGYDFGALMAPMRAVGGDFYDFIGLSEDLLGIVVGDVSDHGVPAALFMAITVTLLRAEARRGLSPAAVLRSVNRQLLEVNAAEMFVTVLYGVLDLRTAEFAYARAGHEPPLVYTRLDEPLPLGRRRGQLLGVSDEPALDEQHLRLPGGATLLLYTDGAREACAPDGTLFGAQGLHRAVAAAEGAAAQGVCEAVLHQVSAHRGLATAQQDDITVVAVQVR